MRWGRLGDRLDRAALLLAVLTALLGGLAIAGLSWWLLWLALGARSEVPNQLDLTKIALSIAAGAGGAVALVVAYRRQRDLERGRFIELFGAAAAQLGDSDVAVRIAGVYAMAGVADEFSGSGRRQQCVNVLCGYLRLPFEPSDGASHLVSRSESIEEAGARVERIYQLRQNDSIVRRTIVDVIVQHLRPSAPVSWSHCDFYLNGAVIEKPDFRDAIFAGRHVSFTRARFIGPVTFERARFTGPHITFRGATFRDGPVMFDQVEFATVGPVAAEPRGGGTTFAEAVFHCEVSFENAVFHGPRSTFDNTTFSGARTSFEGARFLAERTIFHAATFDGATVSFDGAGFLGARIEFDGAQFYGGSATFRKTAFCVANARRSRLRARIGEVGFANAEFHSDVAFTHAAFGGKTVSFLGADFFGTISFANARFVAREVTFDRPKAWVGVTFDWDGVPTNKPSVVKPNPWPPVPTDTSR